MIILSDTSDADLRREPETHIERSYLYAAPSASRSSKRVFNRVLPPEDAWGRPPPACVRARMLDTPLLGDQHHRPLVGESCCSRAFAGVPLRPLRGGPCCPAACRVDRNASRSPDDDAPVDFASASTQPRGAIRAALSNHPRLPRLRDGARRGRWTPLLKNCLGGA